MSLKNQKGFVHIFALLILLVGIVAGVWLVQHKTNLFPKAQETNYIQIVDKEGNPITETTDPNVYLKITLPSGWELPPEKTSGLVKEAFAQECPTSGEGTTTTFGSLTYDSCVDNQGGTNTIGTLCSDSKATKYRCYYSNNSNCISGTGINDFNFDCPTSVSKPAISNSGFTCEPSVMDYVSCRKCATDGSSWGPEGSDFGSNSGSGEWCNCAKKYSTDYYTKATYQVCLESNISILDKLEIFQSFDKGVGDGSGDLAVVTSNFNEYLNKPIPWVLEGLPSQVEEDKLKVFVKFVSYYQDDRYKKARVVEKQVNSVAEIVFKNPNYQPPKSPTPTFSPYISLTTINYDVDLYIHESIKNSSLAERWFRDSIDYINSQFVNLNIKKHFKVDQVFKGIESKTCHGDINGGKGCILDKSHSKIRVWLYKVGTNVDFPDFQGVAYPTLSHIGLKITNQENSVEDWRTQLLAHEIGHLFGLPHFNDENVLPENNQVSGIGILSRSDDVMSGTYYSNLFSPISVSYLNKRESIPIDRTAEPELIAIPRSYTPQETVLEVTKDGKPLDEVKVEVFSGTFLDFKGTIPNDVSFKGVTDSNGDFSLGSYDKIFYNKGYLPGFSVLIRLTKGDDVKYLAITRSYLNQLFFEGNYIKAIIIKDFFELDKPLPGYYLYSVSNSVFAPPTNILPDEFKQELEKEGKEYLRELEEYYSNQTN